MEETKSQSFEENMTRLEELVKKLEDGGLPLEEAIRLFQEGTALVGSCTRLLDQTEQEIVKLTRSPAGGLQEVPFADETAT